MIAHNSGCKWEVGVTVALLLSEPSSWFESNLERGTHEPPKTRNPEPKPIRRPSGWDLRSTRGLEVTGTRLEQKCDLGL